jgi:NAD(P)H-nitrite reductase large subunit
VLGLTLGRGIVINDAMQTSDPYIYAAGDVAQSLDVVDGLNKVVALWPNAVQQGEIAGDRMSDGKMAYTGSVAFNAIDLFGMRIMTCGIVLAPENGQVLVYHKGQKYRRLVTDGQRLLGVILLNAPERAGIYTTLIRDRVPLDSLKADLLTQPGLLLFDANTRHTQLFGGTQA